MPDWWYRCSYTEKAPKEHDAVVAADDSDTRGASAANFAVRHHSSWKMLIVELPLTTTMTTMVTQKILVKAKLQDIDSFNFYRSLA